MKIRPLALALVSSVWLSSCDEKPPAAAAPTTPQSAALVKSDTPLLPVKVGDKWVYAVTVDFAPGLTGPEAEGKRITAERVRTYLGKVSPGEGYPETECFEVTAERTPTEREYVEIHGDRVMLRGAQTMTEGSQLMWYDKAVPFVIAGLRAGSQFYEIRVGDGDNSRQIQVVGREAVTVPAGTYEAVRLLMSGKDGPYELRRTIWFSPRNGIVREEKARYAEDKLLFREVQELTSFTPGA